MVNNRNMPADLICEHADDGTGHCRVCTAGAQTGRYIWPCQIYLAARHAVEVSERQHRARAAIGIGGRAHTE